MKEKRGIRNSGADARVRDGRKLMCWLRRREEGEITKQTKRRRMIEKKTQGEATRGAEKNTVWGGVHGTALLGRHNG